MTKVGVLGATGFVGAAVVEALKRRGADVILVHTPRLKSVGSSASALEQELATPSVATTIAELRTDLDGCAVVVNAAGVAAATRGLTPELLGANALLPLVVAAARPPGSRYVHVSSAAVQGRRSIIDETSELAPFSAYSQSKALAERALADRPNVVLYRPTSVHGPGRDVTRALVRILSSPLATVAGRGDRPTPQVLVSNVADGIAFVSLCPQTPPRVVLHPWEGLTAADLVRLLGGREPRHVPERLARLVVEGANRLGRRQSAIAGLARRLEMMWFGQSQVQGWLQCHWSPPVGHEGWDSLR